MSKMTPLGTQPTIERQFRLSQSASPPAIELIGVSKHFGSVVANREISFDARFGEVHALVGENGAGKSTLMSIVAGLYQPDAGLIRISGQQVTLRSPRDAIAHGIGMVYQHFMLVETMTVAENLLIGLEHRGLRTPVADVSAEIRDLSRTFDLDVHPDAYVWQLSVGEQQRVEILRLLHRGARILVLDEPTAVLTPNEATNLIETVRAMAAEGYCIIFISHKLNEVLAVADRVTVLRRGESAGTVPAATSTREGIARLMVGREVGGDVAVQVPPQSTSIVLSVSNLSAINDRDLPALLGVSLQVQAGEILGIAGVAGNGQRELAEVVTGLRPETGGTCTVRGTPVNSRDPAAIAALGVAYIPEDRLATGLAGGLAVQSNAVLRTFRSAPIAHGPVLDTREIGRFADRLMSDHDVKAPNRTTRVRNLSGGNQQKLIIARELDGEPDLIVASSPTRGVDIGATEFIHTELRRHRERGAAILLISEDLEELRGLSDRIAIMAGGRIVGVLDRQSATMDRLALLMTDHSPVEDHVPATANT